MLAAVLGAACTERRSALVPDTVDSATLAARAARRQAFLGDQEARMREALKVRPFRAELLLERPTVVAFYPGEVSVLDTVRLQRRVRQYAALAQSEGWRFEERYSGTLRLTDAHSQALYAVPISRDSVGLLLATPGYPPQVWYGEITVSALRQRLRAVRGWLPGKAPAAPERL